MPYLIISHIGVVAKGFKKLVWSLLNSRLGYRNTVKNLGRHLYLTELTGLEVIIIYSNLIVACIIYSP